MKRRLLLILPSLQQLHDYQFRLIKYSQFPPLSLLTLAGLTPDDRWEIIVRDEHVESSEVEGDVDLVGIQTYISSSGRAYELADRWRKRGAKVVLGGLHPTSMPQRSRRTCRRRLHRAGRDRLEPNSRRFRARAAPEVLSRALRRLGGAGADAAARSDESAGVPDSQHDGHFARLPALLRFLLQEQFLGAELLRSRVR